jgi:hypothetical protein
MTLFQYTTTTSGIPLYSSCCLKAHKTNPRYTECNNGIQPVQARRLVFLSVAALLQGFPYPLSRLFEFCLVEIPSRRIPEDPSLFQGLLSYHSHRSGLDKICPVTDCSINLLLDPGETLINHNGIIS